MITAIMLYQAYNDTLGKQSVMPLILVTYLPALADRLLILENRKPAEKASTNGLEALMSAFCASGFKALMGSQKPIPEAYEGSNIDCEAVLHKDPKRQLLHVVALRRTVSTLEACFQAGCYIGSRHCMLSLIWEGPESL